MNPVVVRNVAIGEGIPKICVPIVGKTREEAVEKALKELGAKLEDVTIDVEEQKSKGLFGFLAKKEVRVKVTLKEAEKSIRKNLVNPFSCFSDGIKFIVSLPILLLHWFGFISDETTRRAKHNWIIKLLNIIVTLVGFIGGLMSIVMGWNEFWQIICNIF